MALDGGLRCNDQRLGAMNHAPTKPTLVRGPWGAAGPLGSSILLDKR